MKFFWLSLAEWCYLQTDKYRPNFWFHYYLSHWWLENHYPFNSSTIASYDGEWEYDHVGGWQRVVKETESQYQLRLVN